MSMRPFKSETEFIAYAAEKNPPFMVRDAEGCYLVTGFLPNRVFVVDHWVRLDTLAKHYTFVDGTPCGVEANDAKS